MRCSPATSAGLVRAGTAGPDSSERAGPGVKLDETGRREARLLHPRFDNWSLVRLAPGGAKSEVEGVDGTLGGGSFKGRQEPVRVRLRSGRDGAADGGARPSGGAAAVLDPEAADAAGLFLSSKDSHARRAGASCPRPSCSSGLKTSENSILLGRWVNRPASARRASIHGIMFASYGE